MLAWMHTGLKCLHTGLTSTRMPYIITVNLIQSPFLCLSFSLSLNCSMLWLLNNCQDSLKLKTDNGHTCIWYLVFGSIWFLVFCSIWFVHCLQPLIRTQAARIYYVVKLHRFIFSCLIFDLQENTCGLTCVWGVETLWVYLLTNKTLRGGT